LTAISVDNIVVEMTGLDEGGMSPSLPVEIYMDVDPLTIISVETVMAGGGGMSPSPPVEM
jgi:hypothetical protein